MLDIIRFLEQNGVRNITQKGDQLNFCCPFHDDSTPSCGLNVKTKVFNCFGCGAKGTLIDMIARLKGVEVKTVRSDYQHLVIESVKEDLVQKVRQILGRDEIPKNFLEESVLGEWNGAVLPAIMKRVDTETLKLFEVGYSKEYKRTTLPIRDEYGRLVAVMGRINGSGYPKYLTIMPQKGFEKSGYLYGLHLYKRQHQAFMIVCEGHFDVMAFYNAKFPCAVGIMGSWLSDEQKRQILKYTDEVIIATDNDDAGKQAAKQIAHQLRGLVVLKKFKYVVPKKDPSELTQDELVEGLTLAKRIMI